jgi:hypothetical protein
MNVAEHRLRLVQAELRSITGTPVNGEADRLRRMCLWRELDKLVRARDESHQPISAMRRKTASPIGDTINNP